MDLAGDAVKALCKKRRFVVKRMEFQSRGLQAGRNLEFQVDGMTPSSSSALDCPADTPQLHTESHARSSPRTFALISLPRLL
ncbi:MAG: hypothetical protein IJR12_09240 [Bacteroidales bacterium]|nr:hypothetical protein [Bacteroidales bacterium]